MFHESATFSSGDPWVAQHHFPITLGMIPPRALISSPLFHIFFFKEYLFTPAGARLCFLFIDRHFLFCNLMSCCWRKCMSNMSRPRGTYVSWDMKWSAIMASWMLNLNLLLFQIYDIDLFDTVICKWSGRYTHAWFNSHLLFVLLWYFSWFCYVIW